MSDALNTLRKYVATAKSREEKARGAAEIIKQAGGYRWVGSSSSSSRFGAALL